MPAQQISVVTMNRKITGVYLSECEKPPLPPDDRSIARFLAACHPLCQWIAAHHQTPPPHILGGPHVDYMPLFHALWRAPDGMLFAEIRKSLLPARRRHNDQSREPESFYFEVDKHDVELCMREANFEERDIRKFVTPPADQDQQETPQNTSSASLPQKEEKAAATALGTASPPLSHATTDGVSRTRNDERKNMVRDQVFISYSHEDDQFFVDLLKGLKPLERAGRITTWSDKKIKPGSMWFDEIKAALAKTSVAVMLVSPAFLASDFIHDHEFWPLLKDAKAGGVTILWVLIRDCLWKETPLEHYQAVVSPPNKPFAEMDRPKRDTAWRQVCEAIKQAVNP